MIGRGEVGWLVHIVEAVQHSAFPAVKGMIPISVPNAEMFIRKRSKLQ